MQTYKHSLMALKQKLLGPQFTYLSHGVQQQKGRYSGKRHLKVDVEVLKAS